VLRRRQEHPSRWRTPREDRGSAGRPAGTSQHGSGAPSQGAAIVARTRQDREWHFAGNLTPTSPVRQLLENIGAGDPDKIDSWESASQQAQRVDGELGPESRLDCARHHPASVGDAAGRGQPLRQRRHAALRLQWVARRDHQPHLVETETPARQFRDVSVAGMRRVERAPQQADAAAPTVAEARDRVRGRRRVPAWRSVQGRTWPVPRTT